MTKGFVKVGLISAHKFFEKGDDFSCYCNIIGKNEFNNSFLKKKNKKNSE